MFELAIFIVLSLTLECGMGIVYGVAIGYDPLFVFTAAILLNFLSVLLVTSLLEGLLNWKKGLRAWLEKKLQRGRKLIDKYGCIGIILGIVVLSPIQLAIIGKLIGIKPSKLYPSLFGAIFVVATFFFCVAEGVFKFVLSNPALPWLISLSWL